MLSRNLVVYIRMRFVSTYGITQDNRNFYSIVGPGAQSCRRKDFPDAYLRGSIFPAFYEAVIYMLHMDSRVNKYMGIK